MREHFVTILENKYSKLGVKFIESEIDNRLYAVDDERKGIVVLKGRNKEFISREILKELSGIYEVFVR